MLVIIIAKIQNRSNLWQRGLCKIVSIKIFTRTILSGFLEKILKKKYLGASSAVQYFRKPINFFHKNHLNKPTMISKAIDTTLSMTRPTVKYIKLTKQKQSQLAQSTNK